MMWSCRAGKGLTAAIDRSSQLLRKYPDATVWRADITKFFDHVGHERLKMCLQRKVHNEDTVRLLNVVIDSYTTNPHQGIPIGNLTSQVFANIYLNDFDRYVRTAIKPLAYMRYGDDFLLFLPNHACAQTARRIAKTFLKNELLLNLHVRNDVVFRARHGAHFLGVDIFPHGRRLISSVEQRIKERISTKNFSGYAGLVSKNGCSKQQQALLHLSDEYMI